MKTILSHLQTLPEPQKSKAIRNADEDKMNSVCESSSEALGVAFDWAKSPEGFEYWNNFFIRMESRNQFK